MKTKNCFVRRARRHSFNKYLNMQYSTQFKSKSDGSKSEFKVQVIADASKRMHG